MTWHDLLTTYWSQLTLVLVGVGFLIQRILNLRAKKIEISYSIFQQHRLTAVNNFFDKYAVVESMWHQLSIWDIYEGRMTSKQMDAYIWPPIKELEQLVLELNIYFSLEHHKYFEEILDNWKSLNGIISRDYFDYNKEVTPTHKVNNFENARQKVSSQNRKLIGIISQIVKSSFPYK